MIEPSSKKPPPGGDHEPPPKPKRYWWRFTLASVVIVTATAAATAISILLYIGSIANALSHHNVYEKNKLARYLSKVHGGEPETILILGSDKRANLGEERGRSDTTILVRLDPDHNLITVMSIPRDLKVDIPGYGVGKFNAAYTDGGPKLTLRLVKELTGLGVNHVVNVDFLGFVRAVNAIGCVYTDVDRRYYHSNLGVPPAEQYSEINIQPGYQRLCGPQALAFVRYRHTDTDLVRSGRQQAFLSAARQQVPISQLVLGQNNLIDIFTKYTTSDISNAETMLQVLKLFIASRNAEVKQIHFPAVLGPSYVYASESAIHGAASQFLGTSNGVPHGILAQEGGNGKKKASAHRSKQPAAKPKSPGGDGLVPASEGGKLEADAVARKAGVFPVFYPTRLPSGAEYVPDSVEERVRNPRVYHLSDSDGNSHEAYRIVLQWALPEGLVYFGVQGIRGWPNPPILSNPSVTETLDGREYEIYTDGGKVKMVAWHRAGNTYWISNSLLDSLSNEQMIGMARSVNVIIPKPKRARGRR
jgi:polyisoprenyl-teichoic acid--peptidoglycan teichoic acid transferase